MQRVVVFLNPINLFSTSDPLSRTFYAHPTVDVAKDLLGAILVHHTPNGILAGRIVETEAYLGQGDEAAHSCAGITLRTKVIFGPPGHVYVYVIYGMHICLNVVAQPKGEPGCILIRALEPLCGLDVMHANRPTANRPADYANGPGKLTRAMGITKQDYGADLTHGSLTIRKFKVPDQFQIESSPRIGVSRSKDLSLRFFIAHNEYVSRR